jgi:hypothetical protein
MSRLARSGWSRHAASSSTLNVFHLFEAEPVGDKENARHFTGVRGISGIEFQTGGDFLIETGHDVDAAFAVENSGPCLTVTIWIGHSWI